MPLVLKDSQWVEEPSISYEGQPRWFEGQSRYCVGQLGGLRANCDGLRATLKGLLTNKRRGHINIPIVGQKDEQTRNLSIGESEGQPGVLRASHWF